MELKQSLNYTREQLLSHTTLLAHCYMLADHWQADHLIYLAAPFLETSSKIGVVAAGRLTSIL